MTRVQNKHQFLALNLNPNNVNNNPKAKNSDRNLPIGKIPLSSKTPFIDHFVHPTQDQHINQNHQKVGSQLETKRHKIFTI